MLLLRVIWSTEFCWRHYARSTNNKRKQVRPIPPAAMALKIQYIKVSENINILSKMLVLATALIPRATLGKFALFQGYFYSPREFLRASVALSSSQNKNVLTSLSHLFSHDWEGIHRYYVHLTFRREQCSECFVHSSMQKHMWVILISFDQTSFSW